MSQVDIDPNIVRRLIDAQFPHWAHLPVEAVVSSGWDHRTFHLGANMIVRMPSAEVYSPQVEKEQRWRPTLARMLPVPIPVPLALGQPGEGYPWHWSVYAWLPGEAANMENIGDPASSLRRWPVSSTPCSGLTPQADPGPAPTTSIAAVR